MALNEAQRAARESRIGASEVAAVLGLDPYRQAIDVWRRLVQGVAPDLDDNERVFLGTNREDAIAREYERSTGFTVNRLHQPVIRDDLPWLVCNPDRRVIGQEPRRGLEIKNVHWRLAGSWADEPPVHYVVQVQTCALLTGWPVWDVAASIGGDMPTIHTVHADRRWAEVITALTQEFMSQHVEAEVPPPIDYEHPRVLELLRDLYPESPATTSVRLDDILVDENGAPVGAHWHAVFEDAKAQIRRWESVRDGAKARILDAMGEADAGEATLEAGGGYVRKWRSRPEHTVRASQFWDLRFSKNLTGDIK